MNQSHWIPGTLLALFLSACATIGGSEDGIPKRAAQHLRTEYPGAEFVEWSTWEGELTASFYDPTSDRSVEIVYNQQGRWQEITSGMEWEELPAAIRSYVVQTYDQYYATAYRLQRPRSDQYGLTIDTPSRIYTLVFDQKGTLLSSEEEGIDGG